MKTRRDLLKGLLAAGAVIAVAPVLLVKKTPRLVGELSTWHGPLIVDRFSKPGMTKWPILAVKRFDRDQTVGVLFGYYNDLTRQDVFRFQDSFFPFEMAETCVGRPIGDLLAALDFHRFSSLSLAA